jgi:small subunit ribosomal protein S7
MPRHAYKKRKVNADPIYGSVEVAKLINYVMLDGKKATAQDIVYNALASFKKDNKDPMEVLRTAIFNTSPQMEVKARRLGGASYQVPMPTTSIRRLHLSLNWIVDAANARSSKEFKKFELKLIAEITDAFNNIGNAVAKRTQIEKTAEVNKVFAHLKW